MRNKLIVFEGIDGVGKTSLASALKQRLISLGIPVVLYEEDIEPFHLEFSSLKKFIKKSASINTSLFYYLASAIHKSEIIENTLMDSWVICDRFVYSTFASHRAKGYKGKLDLEQIPVLRPDFLFLIKADEKTRLSRVKKRNICNSQDLIPKKRGNTVYKMEKEFEKFSPTVIDNSADNINHALDKIIETIAVKAIDLAALVNIASVDNCNQSIKILINEASKA